MVKRDQKNAAPVTRTTGREGGLGRIKGKGGATMLRTGLLIAASIGLASCGHEGVYDREFSRGLVPAVSEFNLEQAERVCALNSLQTQKETIIRRARESYVDETGDWPERAVAGGAIGGGVALGTSASNPVGWALAGAGALASGASLRPDQAVEQEVEEETREFVYRVQPYEEVLNERLEILRVFETDLDAAYGFAESACRTHMVCLANNSYQTGACTDTSRTLERAQDRFLDVSAGLADVRAQLAESEALLPTEVLLEEVDDRPHRPVHPRPPRREPERCGSAVLGSIFTSGECPTRPH